MGLKAYERQEKWLEELREKRAKERLENAAKLIEAILEGTVVNAGDIIMSKLSNGYLGKRLMTRTELYHAVQDVNSWLAEQGFQGRIERIDAGGSPEWSLVDK